MKKILRFTKNFFKIGIMTIPLNYYSNQIIRCEELSSIDLPKIDVNSYAENLLIVLDLELLLE